MNVELKEPDKIEVDLYEFVGIDIPKDKEGQKMLLSKIEAQFYNALHRALEKDHIKGWDKLKIHISEHAENLIVVQVEPKVVRDLIIFKLKANE